MKPTYFKIPKPCKQDWAEMSITEQGAFCKACAKEVIDLSSVPTNQIKTTIARKNNPCIRILQSQIDEMNFFEWFASISIRKQVKYLFLFSFLLVSQNSVLAQNNDTDFIPYRVDTLVVELPANEITEIPIEDANQAEKTDSINTVLPAEIVISPWILPETEIIIGVPPPPIQPWPYPDIFDIAIIGGYIYEPIGLADSNYTVVDPAQEITLTLGLNTYLFEIKDQFVKLQVTALLSEDLRIKIFNEFDEVVYYDIYEIKKGVQFFSLPLKNFEPGKYRILLKNNTTLNSSEITYL